MDRFVRALGPAGLLAAFVLHSAAAAGLHWSQDLHNEEWIGLTYKKPVVVLFAGNGDFDASVFQRESLEPIADQAEFVWVGADLGNKVAPDQIALERQYNVTQFPTLILLRPFKTGTDAAGDHFSFPGAAERRQDFASKLFDNCPRSALASDGSFAGRGRDGSHGTGPGRYGAEADHDVRLSDGREQSEDCERAAARVR